MTNIRTGIHAVAVAVTLALASAPAAFADSDIECAQSSDYGSSCIHVHGGGLQVTDVQGYFFPPNNDYLTHRRWALELTRYTCDPRGHTIGECRPNHRWFTRVRHGNPPKEGSVCEEFAPYGIGYEQCRDYGEASADAQFGDWRRFPRTPHQFRHNIWLCTTLVVKVHRHWRRNGAAHSAGVRGCASVTA
jgi:hypothetical protein